MVVVLDVVVEVVVGVAVEKVRLKWCMNDVSRQLTYNLINLSLSMCATCLIFIPWADFIAFRVCNEVIISWNCISTPTLMTS